MTTAIARFASAERKYAAVHSSVREFHLRGERVQGDYARAQATPDRPETADPAGIFLRCKDGGWTGLALGTAFSSTNYDRLGIPEGLRSK